MWWTVFWLAAMWVLVGYITVYLEREWLADQRQSEGVFGAICISFIMASFGPIGLLAVVYDLIKKGVFLQALALPSFPKGVFNMKRLIRWAFGVMFWMSVGWSGSEFHFKDWLVNYLTAPPPPPSTEAQRLITSLESCDGWTGAGVVDDHSRLKRGDLQVGICRWYADIYASDLKINNSFTTSETRAINKAAEVCLRRLAAKAMDQKSQ